MRTLRTKRQQISQRYPFIGPFEVLESEHAKEVARAWDKGDWAVL